MRWEICKRGLVSVCRRTRQTCIINSMRITRMFTLDGDGRLYSGDGQGGDGHGDKSLRDAGDLCHLDIVCVHMLDSH